MPLFVMNASASTEQDHVLTFHVSIIHVQKKWRYILTFESSVIGSLRKLYFSTANRILHKYN